MRFLAIILCTFLSLKAGTLHLEIAHQFDSQPLKLHSLKYENAETLSLTRLSYLLSEFALQQENGEWTELGEQYAYIDVGKRRTAFSLSQVPAGSYKGVRFSLGVPKDANHRDPAKLPADHPLNPNLNQLHWDWKTGYIFMALEGQYRDADKELKGYVYHLANDNNLTRIQLAAGFQIQQSTKLALTLDAQKLLSHPRALSFAKDGHSTHSRPGDPIASALVANAQSAFGVHEVSYPPEEIPQKAITPLYLPKNYTPHPFKMSRRFPMPMLPRDNPLITERVELGEALFHDAILSIDGTVSCAACHVESIAFSDERPISRGFEGRFGTRHSMPLFNLAWKSSFFWDGRAKSLREQVLKPIQDHKEMAANLDHVIWRLNRSQKYKQAFDKAFGPGKVTSEKLALTLENYLLTLTSYDSKFDRALSGKETLTSLEQQGMNLFFTEYEPRSQRYGADCFHCHGGAHFSDHQFHNNGLKPTKDLGRYQVTKKDHDKFLFVTPSLRNIAITAPYMHDGRFETLEEVIDHYNGPMHRGETLDPNLAKHPKKGLQLSAQDKAALIAFLKTLTDPKYDE